MKQNSYNSAIKKPNIKKAIIAAIIGIVLVIFDIVWVYNMAVTENIKTSTYAYVNEIQIQKTNREAKQEEQKTKEETLKNKYNPL